MRISDWSSDVCSSDLAIFAAPRDLADLAKAARIDDPREPRPRVHLAAPMLPRDLFLATHLFGHRAARGEFIDFFFPADCAQVILRSRKSQVIFARTIGVSGEGRVGKG